MLNIATHKTNMADHMTNMANNIMSSRIMKCNKVTEPYASSEGGVIGFSFHFILV